MGRKRYLQTPSANLAGPIVITGNLTVTGTVTAQSTTSLTGQLQAADGTASAPSYSFTSDLNTGIFRTAADALAFASAGIAGMAVVDGAGVRLKSDQYFAWTSATVTDVQDTILVRDAANIIALRNGTAAQTFVFGQGNAALAAGRLSMGRDAAAGVAPGAGLGMLRWETGTNAGTLKLVAYSGTSTTGTTIVDNVGAGN